MPDLNEYRNQIDSIDDQLVRLIEERMAVVAKIGEYKRANHMPVLQPYREREVLDRACSRLSDERNAPSVRRIFITLMEVCRETQENALRGEGRLAK